MQRQERTRGASGVNVGASTSGGQVRDSSSGSSSGQPNITGSGTAYDPYKDVRDQEREIAESQKRLNSIKAQLELLKIQRGMVTSSNTSEDDQRRRSVQFSQPGPDSQTQTETVHLGAADGAAMDWSNVTEDDENGARREGDDDSNDKGNNKTKN